MSETTATPAPPRGFKRFRKKAERIIREPEQLRSVAKKASDKLRKHKNRLGELREDLPLLLRLAQAWGRREYRQIPWKSVASIVAALLYFLSPIDFLPDLIPFFGFVDDAAVVGYVLKSFKSDLDAFAQWETGQLPAKES